MEKDYHARLVISDLPGMNKSTLKRLVKWLRTHADEIEKEDQKIFAKKFTARLMK